MCQDKNNLSLSIGDRKLTVQPLLDPPLASPNNRGSILHGGSIWSGPPLTFISLSLVGLGWIICTAYNPLILPPHKDLSRIIKYYLLSVGICLAGTAVLDRIIVHLHIRP